MMAPRETESTTLLHPIRKRIMCAIEAQPGSSLQDLTRQAGVTRTAVFFHVRRLQEEALVDVVRRGNRLLHFPRGVEDPLERGLLDLMRLRNARSILQQLERTPRASWRTLGRSLGLAGHTVRWHVDRLEEQGLIQVAVEAGRRHVVHMHPGLRQWLQRESEPPPAALFAR